MHPGIERMHKKICLKKKNWTRHIIDFLKKKKIDVEEENLLYRKAHNISQREKKRHPSMLMSMPVVLSRCTFCSYT